MASIRLMRKWSVPIATAIAVPIFTPVVLAESDKKDAGGATSRVIRPSDLPIYEEPEEVLDFEYHGHDRTSLEENVGVVRKKVEGVLEATRSTRERIAYVCETGKAHTMATVDMLKELRPSQEDEDNLLPRAGAITVGGLAGLVLGTKKKGGILRKILYTSAGATGAASLCYPRHAYQLSQKAIEGVKDYGTIGYNFVAGVKPQSKVPAPPEPKKEDPPEPEKEKAPVAEAPTEAPSTPEEAPTVSEPESAESGAAEVKQEGKDTIVQLAPPPPPEVEKDYGQSNPEDSDMYTTRG